MVWSTSTAHALNEIKANTVIDVRNKRLLSYGRDEMFDVVY